jgi:hypothetical protein
MSFFCLAKRKAPSIRRPGVRGLLPCGQKTPLRCSDERLGCGTRSFVHAQACTKDTRTVLAISLARDRHSSSATRRSRRDPPTRAALAWIPASAGMTIQAWERTQTLRPRVGRSPVAARAACRSAKASNGTTDRPHPNPPPQAGEGVPLSFQGLFPLRLGLSALASPPWPSPLRLFAIRFFFVEPSHVDGFPPSASPSNGRKAAIPRKRDGEDCPSVFWARMSVRKRPSSAAKPSF